MLRFPFCLTAVAALTACAVPSENTLNRADARAFAADDAFADTLDFTPVDNIPTGTATYEGHIRSDAILNGEDDYEVIGLLELEVDIADNATRRGRDNVSGQITDLNLFDNANDGYDDQELGGRLRISGNTSEGRIDATATGSIDAVLADDAFEQQSTWQVDLNGDIYDNFENGDVVAGSVSGGTTGANSDDYDLLLTGDGRFYGERD